MPHSNKALTIEQAAKILVKDRDLLTLDKDLADYFINCLGLKDQAGPSARAAQVYYLTLRDPEIWKKLNEAY